MVVVKSHPSVDWLAYFESIRSECPWSYAAYQRGLIDIVQYQGTSEPLGDYQARMYCVQAPDSTIEALAVAHDHGQDEWLFSSPGYGEYATPVPVLIQQNRQQLNQLRTQLQQE